MYSAHFGLREPPFGITPDTSFTFSCVSHQEALNTLLVAIGTGEGFIKIVGEVGTGKTLLCRRLLSTLDDDHITAYIPNPYLEPRALLSAIAEELRVPVEAGSDQHQLHKQINQALLGFGRENKRVVVCLDEAQALPLETLEALRLLSNLETEKRKLLQVVLFGQPEMDAKLGQESLRQLRQRITFEYRLQALSRKEVEYYVAHRLRVAGYVSQPLFTPRALNSIYRATRGVPRLVNILAHKCLLVVYGEGGHEAGVRHVRLAAADTPSAYRLPALWWRVVPTLAVAALGSAWLLLQVR